MQILAISHSSLEWVFWQTCRKLLVQGHLHSEFTKANKFEKMQHLSPSQMSVTEDHRTESSCYEDSTSRVLDQDEQPCETLRRIEQILLQLVQNASQGVVPDLAVVSPAGGGIL